MSITLYLMNKKGKAVLEELCRSFEPKIISEVISSKDPNVHEDYYEEIKSICRQHNISFSKREEKKEPKGGFCLAVGWRWIIRPAENLIVFHDSLLPKYRGFSPLVSALINGEDKIGVTALRASEKYDCGDIIAQKSMEIQYPITIDQAVSDITLLYKDLAVTVVKSIQTHSFITYPQNELEATYSIWRDEEDYQIDWNHSAGEIVRFINAVGFPYLGATSWLGSQKVRIIKAVEVDDVKLEQRHTGKVIFIEDGLPIVIAGKGLVKICDLKGMDNSSILPLQKFRTRFR